MRGFPRPDPWPLIRTDLRKARRPPVIAAVGYIGQGAPTVLPLRRGDFLVCDASEPVVKQGLTNAKALSSFRQRGVRVFSVEGLHAKVVASSKFAWVGSTNASHNSENNLIEAAVRVVGSQAKAIFEWASELATEDAELTAAAVTVLRKIKVLRRSPGPVARPRVASLPRRLGQLWFAETGGELTASERALAERGRSRARRTALIAGLPANLIYISSPEVTVGLRTKDWLVEIRSGHVRNPAQVVCIVRHPNAEVIWLCPVKTASRPTIGALRDLVPKLKPGFVDLRVRNEPVVAKVLRAFN